MINFLNKGTYNSMLFAFPFSYSDAFRGAFKPYYMFTKIFYVYHKKCAVKYKYLIIPILIIIGLEGRGRLSTATLRGAKCLLFLKETSYKLEKKWFRCQSDKVEILQRNFNSSVVKFKKC